MGEIWVKNGVFCANMGHNPQIWGKYGSKWAVFVHFLGDFANMGGNMGKNGCFLYKIWVNLQIWGEIWVKMGVF